MSVSCIIPCFNDLETLVPLLKKLSNSTIISEIICVDDGSEIPVLPTINTQYPQIICIQHKHNLGKSASMRTAIDNVSNKTLLFLDSDIISLDVEELEIAIQKFTQKKLDMLLLCSDTFYLFNRLSRHNILFTGIRICKTSTMQDFFLHEFPDRYQWEIAIDRYMLQNEKNVAYTFMRYQTKLKEEKIGWLHGTLQNITMLFSIIVYRFPTYIQLLIFFGHTRIKLTR